MLWPHHEACGILVPQPEIELMPPAVEVQNLNHWITREVPQLHLLSLEYKSSYFMQRFRRPRNSCYTQISQGFGEPPRPCTYCVF